MEAGIGPRGRVAVVLPTPVGQAGAARFGAARKKQTHPGTQRMSRDWFVVEPHAVKGMKPGQVVGDGSRQDAPAEQGQVLRTKIVATAAGEPSTLSVIGVDPQGPEGMHEVLPGTAPFTRRSFAPQTPVVWARAGEARAARAARTEIARTVDPPWGRGGWSAHVGRGVGDGGSLRSDPTVGIPRSAPPIGGGHGTYGGGRSAGRDRRRVPGLAGAGRRPVSRGEM